MKEAFALCKRELMRLGKHLRPKKLRANLLVGTGDPATTAQILQVYSVLYPLVGQNIFITPDLEHPIVKGDFLVRGSIRGAVLLWSAWVIYKDKNIRKVIRLAKKTN
jgi:hypothetical protein